jgi:hypothetical protein
VVLLSEEMFSEKTAYKSSLTKIPNLSYFSIFFFSPNLQWWLAHYATLGSAQPKIETIIIV